MTAANSLGQRVQKARHARGLSLAQLARLVGTDKGYLSRVENNHIEPRITSLRRIAKELGVSIARLVA